MEDLRTRQTPRKPFEIDKTGQRLSAAQAKAWWGPRPMFVAGFLPRPEYDQVWYSLNAKWRETNPATCRCGVGLIYQSPPDDIAHGQVSDVLAAGGVHVTVQRFKPSDRGPRGSAFFRTKPTKVAGRDGFMYAARKGDNAGVNVSFRWMWWEEVSADGSILEVNVETDPDAIEDAAARQIADSLRPA